MGKGGLWASSGRLRWGIRPFSHQNQAVFSCSQACFVSWFGTDYELIRAEEGRKEAETDWQKIVIY